MEISRHTVGVPARPIKGSRSSARGGYRVGLPITPPILRKLKGVWSAKDVQISAILSYLQCRGMALVALFTLAASRFVGCMHT